MLDTGTSDDSPVPRDVEKQLPEFEGFGTSWLHVLMSITAISLSLYLMYYALTRYTARGQHTILALGWGVSLYLLIYLLKTDRGSIRGKIDTILTTAMITITVGLTFYFYDSYRDLIRRTLFYTELEYLLGALLIIILVEGTRRAYGPVLTGVIVGGFMYGYLGPYLPWWFNHAGMNYRRLVEMNVLTLDGAFGSVPAIGVTLIAIFLIYAGILEAYGAMNLVFAIGRAIESRFAAGAAQSAVISSLFMGSISGSAVANTATTGSFTIPLMKSRGFKKESAAAIESSASSGGQVMPPVMGAAAFVMTGLLNITYLTVITAALLPGILFYYTISASTQVLALKQSAGEREASKTAKDDDQKIQLLKNNRTVLIEGVPIILSVVLLVYFLAVLRMGVLSAAFRATVAVILMHLAWTAIRYRLDPSEMFQAIKDTILGLQMGAVTAAPLIVILGSVATLINMLQVGDFTRLLTFAMLDSTGGSLLVLLTFAAIMSLIFGLGMPTVVAYILVAIFVGPAIIEFGLPQLYAHFFVFYFAILSAITPPVALACVVACEIAGASFFGTCKEALKISAPAFILPYSFVIHPNLIDWNSTSILSFALIMLGILGIIIALNRYVTAPISRLSQGLALVSGVSIMLVNNTLTDLIAAGIILVVLVYNYRGMKLGFASRMQKAD